MDSKLFSSKVELIISSLTNEHTNLAVIVFSIKSTLITELVEFCFGNGNQNDANVTQGRRACAVWSHEL